ncbi:sensor histidine kinase [Paenibacillus validus]|uniref:histidine kinase n=1 Tax=Paenibacillus validus TaxID=44253 RepID=A0A7X3CRF8_9BACL|nr:MULTISPECIES: sensor histidine kinase [Paenibacillus]MED4599387.1 sensor histidine kinase [Paenibacillus validus]MED4606301.1 sensor histidine kinase [Paenibacillus validus]MUG70177.1 sensor histidine kinase [Paenibacillus validus]
MRERLAILTIIMFATAFFGEMKVNPFGGSFRFSLGIAAFFFGLLWFRSVPVIPTGLLTGAFILCFRLSFDQFFYGIAYTDSLQAHLPSAVYYVSFTLLIHMSRARRHLEFPFRVGLIGTAVDFTSNMVELLVRYSLGDHISPTWQSISLLLLFASLRSMFVVGLYNNFSIRQLRAVGKVRQQELERLRMINTNLYEETFYLRKSMAHLEEITRKSYQLYKRLCETDHQDASTALHVTENVHEVKKDSQRILAGLSKLMHQEELASRITVMELCGLVIRTNRKYAEMLGKPIAFHESCGIPLVTSQIYALLSVLNNLVANAVEAIGHAGRIELAVHVDGRDLVFLVADTGPGIPQEEQEWVFQSGYTTKYDTEGNASTGIGLTHALGIVHSLNGTLRLLPSSRGTRFEVRIPIDQLLSKEVVACSVST